MPTVIVFRSGAGKTVDGSPEEVSRHFEGRAAGPVRLTTVEGSIVFVNWSNVLYFEDASPPLAASTSADE